ncbi:hypothetical protein Efla_003022 [Eimeria flavescens]
MLLVDPRMRGSRWIGVAEGLQRGRVISRVDLEALRHTMDSEGQIVAGVDSAARAKNFAALGCRYSCIRLSRLAELLHVTEAEAEEAAAELLVSERIEGRIDAELGVLRLKSGRGEGFARREAEALQLLRILQRLGDALLLLMLLLPGGLQVRLARASLQQQLGSSDPTSLTAPTAAAAATATPAAAAAAGEAALGRAA